MSGVARVIQRLSPISAIAKQHLPSFNWSLGTLGAPSGNEQPWTSFTPQATADLRTLIAAQRSQRRCVIFGEQHHQPRVLAAQLTVLDEILRESPPRSLVLEMFNVLQQPMLDAFADSYELNETGEQERKAAEALLNAYGADGGETFDLSHYLPLLLLARSASMRIVGGFPPRAWARRLAKEGLTGDLRSELEGVGFDRWDDLKTSSAHRAYITSLVRGEQPVLPTDEAPTKGIASAQVLKDAVMAFSIDRALTNGGVMAICGSGHCEYGFGVPERVQGESYTVVTKPNDEMIWRGERWGEEGGTAIADDVILYEAVNE